MERQIVFLMPGPIHLFWTSGVFYAWELGKRYQVVLLVNSSYEKNERFKKLTNSSFIEHIVYLSPRKFTMHYYYPKKFLVLLKKYSPKAIFLYDHVLPDCQYLLHCCEEYAPNCLRFVFLAGRTEVSHSDDYKARHAFGIDQIQKTWSFIVRWSWLARFVYFTRNKIKFWFVFTLMPLLFIRHRLKPAMNFYTGEYDLVVLEHLNQSRKYFWLAYLETEIKILQDREVNAWFRIDHPMKQCWQEVFEFFFGKFNVKEQIIMLPTIGLESRLFTEGLCKKDVVSNISGKWCEAIDALRVQYPYYTYAMKLHPSAKGNALWESILDEIGARFSDIDFLPTTEIAEWHIVQSKIIVSDVSTVLWWATLMGGKIVISLDLFDYPAGDEMRLLDKVIYINSIDQFRKLSEITSSDYESFLSPSPLLDFVEKTLNEC
jgi:hypothetical protein